MKLNTLQNLWLSIKESTCKCQNPWIPPQIRSCFLLNYLLVSLLNINWLYKYMLFLDTGSVPSVFCLCTFLITVAFSVSENQSIIINSRLFFSFKVILFHFKSLTFHINFSICFPFLWKTCWNLIEILLIYRSRWEGSDIKPKQSLPREHISHEMEGVPAISINTRGSRDI